MSWKPAVQRVANGLGYAVTKLPPPPINHHEVTRGLAEPELRKIQDRVAEYHQRVRWFHSFDFGHGIEARGFATLPSLSQRVRDLGLDQDLKGASFLDIASWDGFYAFEAERRGAGRVLATDYFCWGHGGWGSKDGFLLARELLKSKVDDREIEVQDLSPETVGMWDVVLFSGIFYHMRDPIEALTAAASVTTDRLIVETHIIPNTTEAFMRYMPRTEGNETSNYWRPTTALVLTLLTELGFRRIDHHVAFDAPEEPHGFFNAYR